MGYRSRVQIYDDLYNNKDVVLMRKHALFYNWEQFDAFSYHAKKVVTLLEAMGY